MRATQPTPTRFGDLLASSWNDWSGFFAWAFRIGLIVLVVLGISIAADWTTEAVFGGRSSALALLGTQALKAVFNGLGIAVTVTALFLKRFVRSRIPHSFTRLWIGFTVFSFVLSVGLPLPLWQAVVMKVAVLIVGIWIAWSLNQRWWRAFWIAADAEEDSHV